MSYKDEFQILRKFCDIILKWLYEHQHLNYWELGEEWTKWNFENQNVGIPYLKILTKNKTYGYDFVSKLETSKRYTLYFTIKENLDIKLRIIDGTYVIGSDNYEIICFQFNMKDKIPWN
jgi:hypothetical protein